jgi:hypothetical protein
MYPPHSCELSVYRRDFEWALEATQRALGHHAEEPTDYEQSDAVLATMLQVQLYTHSHVHAAPKLLA